MLTNKNAVIYGAGGRSAEPLQERLHGKVREYF
jgi:hypothetical protein